ncbi:hypothetical protein AURDEDRAFT_131406 [Auricularia subglabra TFB-10046 SS5]|uniref:RING-type domain-containing protein n=1 Tax=Auricularia subglabra (strain TFB-10046 / SS5) TaxID=717982 RepID=J0D5F1_AURST|nr:hypothetical protein AURDEDRAFT_131406 [Auricularia subglabra TFB-10046 SS5]
MVPWTRSRAKELLVDVTAAAPSLPASKKQTSKKRLPSPAEYEQLLLKLRRERNAALKKQRVAELQAQQAQAANQKLIAHMHEIVVATNCIVCKTEHSVPYLLADCGHSMCQRCMINFFVERRADLVTGLFANAFEHCPLCKVLIRSPPVRPYEHQALLQAIHKTVTVIDLKEDFKRAFTVWQARRKSHSAATLCYHRAIAAGRSHADAAYLASTIALGYVSAFEVGWEDPNDNT